jgi:GT2 family glycosyltransferase
MKVSVIICTWNRASLLDQTLTEFPNLKIPVGIDWEVLVVNNNCTDETDVVISRHADRLPLRRLFEPKQGQSNARNCAIENAKGDLVIWTDDDVLVDPLWLEEYVKAAEKLPTVSFFGGTIEPWFAETPPLWLRHHLLQLGFIYAVRQLGQETRPFHEGELPFGANMCMRRSVFDTHLFDPQRGLCGSNQVRGDETEILRAMQKAGHKGVWVGAARVRHFIPADRLNATYIWDWFQGSGRLMARQQGLADCKHLWGAPRWAVLKYWRAKAKSLVLTPFRGPRWLHAFREAAVCRGIILESRALSRDSFPQNGHNATSSGDLIRKCN